MRAEIAGIFPEFDDGFSGAFHQQRIEAFLIAVHQESEIIGDGEYDVEVLNR
jgi:hypothetical protein